jgi:hypothetical protein
MNVPPSFVSFSFGITNNAPSSSPVRDILKFLLVAPFRGLARLLWVDGLLDREEHRNQIISSSISYSTDGGAAVAHMASPPPSTFHHYPGPWSFFASGYAVSLFAMVRRVHRSVSRLYLTLVRRTNRLYS